MIRAAKVSVCAPTRLWIDYFRWGAGDVRRPLRMGMVTGVTCQAANGRERLPQDSICEQAHIWVILCRVAFWRESLH